MAKTKSLEDLDLWLILGSPRGRLRNALSRALREFEAEKPLSVVSLDLYIRPEKDLPRLEGGAWNLAHEDAIDWTHLHEDLKDLSDTGEVVVICDDRAAGCRALLEACKRMIVCSSTELGCFKDCILSRVTLEDYTRRIWPTYKQRVSRLWDWLAEDANLLRKASMLDEDDFREKSTRDVMDNFARKHLEELLDARAGNVAGSVKMLEKKEIGKWKGRIYEAPERNQRKFQQVRKDVLYAFEMEARSFASSMTKQLLSGSMKDAEVALKALDAYRLSLHSMSHEERAKWASVICTREVGPQGQVLSVEILRWAWKRLRELRDDEVSPELGQARVLQVLEAAESADELTPFARLLGPENAVLEGVCAAVDNVIQFGRLFFLRQRMWDAQPEITLELAKLLLEHKHWLLQSLGTRFCAQLLDADPARYQVCFRDLTRNRESPPFALILARALLNVAGPVFGPAAVDFEKDQEVEALWKGEWYSARFLKHNLERHEIEIEWKTQVEASERRQWCCEGWVRSLRAKKDAGSGYDYWKWLRDRHLVDASALRKLLNRAPEHCLHLIQEPRLVESLRSLLHQALHRGLLHLSAEASACLSRLLRYGPSETIMVGGGHDLRDVQSLILGLSDLGSKESLGEATNYFTTLNWSAQWRQDDAPAAWKPRCPPSPTPVRAPGKTPAAPRAEDPAVRVLELLELQKELQQEQQLRSAAQQQQLKAEEELKSSKEMIARLLEEKKEMAQRLPDLDAERPERPAATAATASGSAGSEEAAGDAEENDWMLKADPDTLTLADAEGFISRIATRRDNVRVLRSSLCGGLRQLGEKLYASPVHFIEELLQNADDCSYGSEIEPSFKIEATASACRFSYNELGFRAKDVLSLCSLAVSTKTFGDFLGHKGVGFKSVFACSNAPCIVSGKFRFKFQVPGIDELSYITPRWLDDVQGCHAHGPYGGTEGTHIWLPFRPELSGNQDFLEKLRCAVDPLVLLGLRQLRRLSFQMEGETQVAAHLTKTAVEDFREIKTWKACLRINDQDHLYRLFSYDGAGKAVLAFPAAPGPELPVCAGLPCARVGHRFLLQANWQLTTSREAVRESVENYQLRSEAAKLFCVAARHPDILPHLALFLPATGPGTPPFWQTFAEELLHELRLVLPELGLGLGATATLRLPEERIMALVEPQVFVAAGLELVQDEAAQLVMQKCGIPALGIADLFACFPHFETLGIVKPESWWAELFQLLLENAGKPQLEELVKRQPIWCLRGSGRRCCLPENGEIVFCSVPTSFSKSWRSQVVFLDTHSTAELRFALLTVAKTWDATVMAAAVLHCHLELRRDELKVDEALRGLLWRDLDFLKNVWDELRQLPVEVPAAPGEMALVPSEHGASTACLTTVPTVLGCKVPRVTGCGFGSASPVALPYGDVMVVSEAIAWEDFLLKLGCRAPVLDARSCPLGTFILPPLAEMLCASSQMKNVLCALPARSLQWFQENVSMCAVSGQIVPLNALVAEGLLRNLPKVPEGLEVVPVPREMEDLAASLGICVRQDVDMCWLILRSLCDAGVRSVGPYVENLAMLQSLRGDASASDLPKNQAILFLPSSSNAEPSFAALSEIYVTQEFGTETMPKDEEEAKVLEMGFEELRQFLGRSVISCTHNVAYWSFSSELKLMGCAERPSVAEALQALQRAAQEPRFRQRIGRSSVKDRGELLNDHGLEVMLSLYRLLELALSAVEDVPSWDWKERLTPTRVLQPAAALTAACSMHGPLPIVTWEGRLVTGGSSEVWACRSSWFLDSVLDAAPICFIHRDVAEHCPRLVAASSWFYVEGRTTIVWQQSNNPEKELTEVSEAFSEVLRRQIQVVSCNWIALELFFSPKVEPKETEWFSDVPGLIKERLRAQPSFAMIGGVLVLATHFVKEAAERAALAAAALALALQEMGKTREDAEALARETCEKIRSFTSERFWEASSSQSHAGYNIRQVRSTEVLLPSGIGEEATLPGLMGSFGAVEQYEDDEEANAMRLRGCPGERRDHELFTDALGRILSDHGTVSYRKTAAPANAAEILAVKEQQKRVGERAEHFYSCFLESVFGDAYKPTRDWVSSARLCVYPGRGTDDACGFDFVVLDTAQRIVPCQGKRSVRCFIEVKGSAGDFNGMFCLSANEQRKRDQIAASKSDGNAYVIAVVDNLDSLEFASIRHFIWSESGAQIQVVDGNTPGLANLKIEGSKAQIHHAKQLIQEVVYSQSSQWDARTGRVWKGNGSAGSVWGPHGSASSSQGWQ